jgi:hypothetical protein
LICMRKIFCLLLLALPAFLNAQSLPIDSASKTVTYVDIVNVPGATKDQLYMRAREWFALSFKSANNVIQMDDKENGKLIGKGQKSDTYMIKSFMTVTPIDQRFYFTISITVKDSRYRVIINDITYSSGSVAAYPIEGMAQAVLQPKNSNKMMLGIQQDIISKTNNLAADMNASIKAAMISAAKKDDF